MKVYFVMVQEAIGKRLEDLLLDHLFWLLQAILLVVDAMFIGDQAVGMDDALTHIVFKDWMLGRVDLWFVIEVVKIEDYCFWY